MKKLSICFFLVINLIFSFSIKILACNSDFIRQNWQQQTPFYLTAKVKDGEGVFALLRRFDLDDFDCNIEQFYTINDMDENDPLLENKTYKIPIRVYEYNGKSIRSSIDISDLSQAKRIEEFNEKMFAKKIKKEPLTKGKQLWVPYHEMGCVERKIEDKEPSANKKAVSIFEDEAIKVRSNRLKNKVFYIDAGHGGPDPGAMAKWKKNKICEDEYAYDVSIRLSKMLLENGATVYMITRDPNDGIRDEEYLPCDSDEVHYPNKPMALGQKKRLTQRAVVINELFKKHKKEGVKSQKLICIHVDSRGKSERTDVFFYFKPGSEASESLAINLQNTFANNYPKGRAYEGSVTERDLFMLRETRPTSAYVELGNLRNQADLQRLLLENNRTALALWLYEGLTK
jgi:N-acetylmuramoyl-L-alanine amidase